MRQLILATRNEGKVREISALIAGVPFRIVSAVDVRGIPEVAEDGATLEENALKKARETYNASGFPSLSDDTGLEVFALNMEPGVRSARYAGENATYAQNNSKLLTSLAGLRHEDRGARFRCVAAFVDEGIEHVAEGVCEGVIAEACRGEGGFGYDPLFIPAGLTQTFAELPLEMKNSISHRSQAFLRMRDFLLSLRR